MYFFYIYIVTAFLFLILNLSQKKKYMYFCMHVCESFEKVQKCLVMFRHINSLWLHSFFIWKASFLPATSCILILIKIFYQ